MSNIDQALKECQESAEQGYQLAMHKYREIEQTLSNEKKRISEINREQNQVSRIQNVELIQKQSEGVQRLESEIQKIFDDIQLLHDRQKYFSILVYGRTMAGKSTLMEILTHGNGQSIGKGAQRTTLDVRDYFWNGMKITDVPGIGAFGGAEDERLADDAAKSADLIIFLLTNDAPQADEAECLARLKSMGKPVLGIINVKKSLRISQKDRALRDLNRALDDTETINNIIEQFKAFDKKHNQDWSGIKFVATHLLAAFEGRDDPEIYKASKFEQVEEFILNKVQTDGKFLRIKNFSDIVAVPMNRIILAIFEHSANALKESDIWYEKRDELQSWRENFLERSQKKLDRLYDQLAEELNDAIYNFAEDHYEDEKVNENWSRRIRSLHFENRYKDLLKSFADECDRKRRELSDELSSEIKYTFRGNTQTSISLEDTTPWGKYATLVLPNLLMFVPGIGWGARIAIGVGGALFSFLFEDKQEKIRQAKKKLRSDLSEPSFDMLGKMHSQIIDIFNDKILHEGVDGFSDSLANYQFMLARLGKSQSEIASSLLEEFRDLNIDLLNEEKKIYKDRGDASCAAIARIPGVILLILTNDSNANPDALSDLLGEKVQIDPAPKEFSDAVKKVLGCDFDIDYYPLDFSTENGDTPEFYSIIPKNSVPQINLQLAQQIANDVPIIT